MRNLLKKGLMTLALIAGFSFMTPTSAMANDGYIFVKDRRTGQQNCYELNYGGWIMYVDHFTLFSNDEGKTWYIINY